MPLSSESRDEIFLKLKTTLEKFAPPMVISKSSAGGIELIGNVPVPYGSKKIMVPGMYFSSAVARKDMVSFYFFPIYMHQKEFMDLIPTLSKCMKGKSCFNFKKPEQVSEKELKALLKKGAIAWKKLGYVK
jgi:hypothetical protein